MLREADKQDKTMSIDKQNYISIILKNEIEKTCRWL